MCIRELARFVSCAARLYDSLEVERTHIIVLTYEKHVEPSLDDLIPSSRSFCFQLLERLVGWSKFENLKTLSSISVLGVMIWNASLIVPVVAYTIHLGKLILTWACLQNWYRLGIRTKVQCMQSQIRFRLKEFWLNCQKIDGCFFAQGFRLVV